MTKNISISTNTQGYHTYLPEKFAQYYPWELWIFPTAKLKIITGAGLDNKGFDAGLDAILSGNYT